MGPAAGDELASVSASSRVIAVIVPNDERSVTANWATYRTSAAEVERRTGFRFFDRLLPGVAEALRRRVDQTPVAPVRARSRAGEGG